MLTQRNILYFTPFYFKNGAPPKNKYFIVLSAQNDKIVLASLPTSKDYVPNFVEADCGCVEVPDADFNCFIITPEQVITECGKQMPRKTYIYGQEILDDKTEKLKEQYQIENTDYVVFGKMKPDFFNSLIQCLKASNSVKNKYKKLL